VRNGITEALSPKKRELAEILLRRLAKRFAPGGFAHGAGQVVSGRAAAALGAQVYWRGDGVALWRNPALLDDTAPKGDADIGAAQRLPRSLRASSGWIRRA
jgi:uncharacterized protein (DUF2126 family)